MKNARLSLFLILTVLISACSVAPSIESVEDGIALGYVSVKSVANSTKAAYEAGLITEELKVEIKKDLQEAKDMIDATLLISKTDIGAARDNLQSAQAILISLQKILQEYEQ